MDHVVAPAQCTSRQQAAEWNGGKRHAPEFDGRMVDAIVRRLLVFFSVDLLRQSHSAPPLLTPNVVHECRWPDFTFGQTD